MEDITTKKEFKSVNKKMWLICAPLCALAVLLSWVSILVNSDGVIGSNVYVVSILDLIVSICEISIYATALAFIVYAVAEKQSIAAPCLIFFVLSVLRYFSSAFVSGLTYGALSASYFISAAIVLATDTVIVGILILISYPISKKSKEQGEKISNSIFLPDLSKTVDRCLFIFGIIWAAIKLISQVIYDINYIILIGAPSAANIVWMVIYYLFAILICPIFYLISSFTIRFIRKGQDKSF